MRETTAKHTVRDEAEETDREERFTSMVQPPSPLASRVHASRRAADGAAVERLALEPTGIEQKTSRVGRGGSMARMTARPAVRGGLGATAVSGASGSE